MHYITKRSIGRLALATLICVGIVHLVWEKESPKESVVSTEAVIEPTPALLVESPNPLPQPSLRHEEIIIKAGDTLAKRLEKLGVSPQTIHQLQASEDAKKHLKTVHPGQKLTVAFSENNQLVKLEHTIDSLRSLVIELDDDQSYKAELVSKSVTTLVKFASATIQDSLFVSGSRAGLSDATIMQLANIFGYDIDFALDIQPGDTFSVLYEEKFAESEKIGNGNILAARFVNHGRIYEAIRYQDAEGHADYYTPEGKSLKKAFLRSPVNFTRISSRFSLGRKHPVLHSIRAHKGVDYAAPTGTPIKAAGSGKVAFKGVKGGYGNVVILQHGQQYSTLYAHMSRFAKNIKVGDRVKQGDIIGYVGMSGLATGPHLHYEFHVNGVHVNPLTVTLPQSEPIAQAYLNDFKSHAKTILAQLDYQQNMDIAYGK